MQSILVTGGGGFVGTALVRMLLDRGYDVRVVGRNEYPHLEGLGVVCHVADIADHESLTRPFSGVDTVFHTAAKAGIWGVHQHYYETNVLGTNNVVRQCQEQGINRLIYTSTPSVVFAGDDIVDGDESLPYAKKFLCHYARTKVAAEKHVLGSNSSNLQTCAIRPHLIWGPGDPHLIPRILERGREGGLKIVGNGQNLVDISYIDNVALAHILAAEKMGTSGIIGGHAYFIGQERPVRLWDWINEIFTELDIAPVTRRVPFSMAYGIGWIMEALYRLLPTKGEPKMTRFLAEQLSRSHYFSHARAARDFGYSPLVTLEDGQQRLLNWLQG